MRSLKEKKARAYQLRARADKQAETHRLLAEAAFELHSTVGPSGTTISAIAERAGVQRLTVYRHFADQGAIFAACTAHAFALDPPPDPSRWAPIANPAVRLRVALADTYGYYTRNHRLLMNIYRDIEMPVVATEMARWAQMLAGWVAVLDAGWGEESRLRRAALGHAIDFGVWQSLTQTQGLSEDEAIEAMVRFVRVAAE